MNSKEPTGPEMIAPVPPPEFFITQICKMELVDGLVRVYCCVQKDADLEIRCTVLVPLTRVGPIGKQCLTGAAALHSSLSWSSTSDES